jgi:hypothetical protein
MKPLINSKFYNIFYILKISLSSIQEKILNIIISVENFISVCPTAFMPEQTGPNPYSCEGEARRRLRGSGILEKSFLACSRNLISALHGEAPSESP